MKEIITNLVLGIISTVVFFSGAVAQNSQSMNNEPVPIIYDSDFGPMTKSTKALAVLHALAIDGEAKILATLSDHRYPEVASLLDLYNTYYFKGDIPVGVPQKPVPAVDNRDAGVNNVLAGPLLGGWANVLVDKYPHDLRSFEIAHDAVDVYRAVLSSQPDNSVTVLVTGFMTNLSSLLVSGPDEHSNLTGLELVEKKVNKLVSMAGTFINLDKLEPGEKARGEYNLRMDAKASKHVFETWPTEIIYLGFDLGVQIWTGADILQNDAIQNNPFKDALHMTSKGYGDTPSWDPAAALVAVRGADLYFDLVPGRITVDWDGTNGWDSSREGQYYLTEKEGEGFAKIEDEIDRLMQYQPDRKKLKDYPRGH